MKYENNSSLKRGHKNRLTKGAFGKCKNIPEGYDSSKMKVIPRSKRISENAVVPNRVIVS